MLYYFFSTTYQALPKGTFPRNWINYDGRVKNTKGMDEVPFSPVPNSLDENHPGYEVAQVSGDQFCTSVGTELSATIIWGTSHKQVDSGVSADNQYKFKATASSCSCNVVVSDSMFKLCGLTFMSILITLWRGL